MFYVCVPMSVYVCVCLCVATLISWQSFCVLLWVFICRGLNTIHSFLLLSFLLSCSSSHSNRFALQLSVCLSLSLFLCVSVSLSLSLSLSFSLSVKTRCKSFSCASCDTWSRTVCCPWICFLATCDLWCLQRLARTNALMRGEWQPVVRDSNLTSTEW